MIFRYHLFYFFFFSSRRRHTRFKCDWSSDVCSSDLGEIGAGLMILLGVGREDSSATASALAEKAANLRIFADQNEKMNLSLLDVKGGALVVSQFTLYGDASGGRAPRFIAWEPTVRPRARDEK